MLTIENVGKRIYIFNKDGYEINNNFKPYFYYENEKGNHTSLFGKPLLKLEVNDPKDVPKMRDDYLNPHEADVVYTTRYMIDKYDKIEKEDYRIFYLDIELEMNEKTEIDVENTPAKINIIGIFDSQTKKYHQFSVPPDKIDKNYMVKENDLTIYYYKSEKEMLESFISFVKKLNPNIFVAWYGWGFDYPYIINRMNKLNINYKFLSQIGIVYSFKDNWKNKWKVSIKGKILFDLLEGYKKLAQNERESYSLDYIGKYELGEGKDKFDVSKSYQYKFKDFLKYNKQDVALMVKLDKKLKITNYFDEVRRISHCHFNDTLSSSKIHDSLLLYICRKMRIVLPSKTQHERKKFKGAYVKEPIAGLHDNVAVFDLKSLYPNIIRTFNLSPETFLDNYQEGCINVDNKYYFKKNKKGLIPHVINQLLIKRIEKKKEMEKYKYGSIEYKSADDIQYAVKIIANSLYGQLGYPRFRLFKYEIAACITYLGQRIIKHTIKFLEGEGFKITGSDTDSVFVLMGNKTIEECKIISNKITKNYDEFVKQFNVKNHYLEMEFEKVYRRIFFVKNESGKVIKKRYAGNIIWKDGKNIDVIDITGFEQRRSDSPQIIRDFQKDFFEKILRGVEKEKVVIFINKFKENFYNLKEELGIPIGINVSKKENHTPIHIRAAELSNKRHKTNFKKGDKIKYIYVNKNPSEFSQENVIAFQDKIPDGYKIDYDKMWNRLAHKKINIIFKNLNWDMSASKSLFSRW